MTDDIKQKIIEYKNCTDKEESEKILIQIMKLIDDYGECQYLSGNSDPEIGDSY